MDERFAQGLAGRDLRREPRLDLIELDGRHLARLDRTISQCDLRAVAAAAGFEKGPFSFLRFLIIQRGQPSLRMVDSRQHH